MPVTYHFTPFPKPGEPHLEAKPQQTESEISNPQCFCQEPARCRRCRRPERSNRSSQTVLPSIKEEASPVPRSITPKAIREQRRAAMRISVSDAFNEAVGDEDYFTFYHPTAFARSPSASSESTYRERRNRRLGSASRSKLSKSTTEQVLPPIPSLAAADSTESLEEEEPDDTRRDS